ncbi:lytic transglycosylase domain-containing protein [Caproiciproducens sp. NJN-50]|uniref:lytic transglycosylase domain-containing protein n=1 Tax=Acutalibacteraceae TaxID=3082771 RepID=UPI000FFE16DC|nr:MULTISPECIES: lytic transglycosylase domain-containing protein [Acutalibacteraceae]QAT50776.1 lytic transglycosylase domain-containing protein [Caproiciproducens sp. NJN-50]
MKTEAVFSARCQTARAVQAARTSSGTGGFAAALKNAVSGGQGLDDIFDRASRTYGVPENLLKAVAKAESGFQADAVSRCGAQGIMQLMPSTARSLGVTDSFDPEQNIMGGAKYLGSLLGKYGDAKLAVAAYNAGSGNVDKYGGVPPFSETQNYVEKVLSYAGGDVSVPSGAAESGTAAAASAGTSVLSAVSFTADDYSRFLELFAQELMERTLSLSDSGDVLQAGQDTFLM